MKKLLLILLCLPMIGFGQQTFVPDDNFENYLEANGMGNGIANDDSVLTSAIDTVTYLNISSVWFEKVHWHGTIIKCVCAKFELKIYCDMQIMFCIYEKLKTWTA